MFGPVLPHRSPRAGRGGARFVVHENRSPSTGCSSHPTRSQRTVFLGTPQANGTGTPQANRRAGTGPSRAGTGPSQPPPDQPREPPAPAGKREPGFAQHAEAPAKSLRRIYRSNADFTGAQRFVAAHPYRCRVARCRSGCECSAIRTPPLTAPGNACVRPRTHPADLVDGQAWLVAGLVLRDDRSRNAAALAYLVTALLSPSADFRTALTSGAAA